MRTDGTESKGRDIGLDEAAWQLHHSRRWLQQVLANDMRKPAGKQRFQFHRYIGRRIVWSEQVTTHPSAAL
jgi:hypothetical protein